VRLHNAAHCISGTVWRELRRGAPTPLAELEAQNKPVDIPGVQGSSQEVKDGILGSGGHEVDLTAGFGKLVVSATGNVYVWGSGDGVLSNADALYTVRGRFLVGNAATELMKASDNAFIELKMDSETLVLAEFAAPVEPPQGQPEWQHVPQPIGKLLQFLESAGHVRLQIHRHTVARDGGAAHGFQIKPDEEMCLSATVMEKGTPTLATFSAFTSIPDTKKSENLAIVWMVKYDPDLRKIQVGIPAVHTKQQIRIRTGTLYQLC